MEPAIRVRDVIVRSASGRDLLSIPELDVEPGEAVVVRGPSGAGKSTLLYALAGLVLPTAGSIRWGETEISSLGDAERTRFRRKYLGMVFQDHLLFEELTAAGNAALPSLFAPKAERRAVGDRAGALLHKLGIGAEPRRVTTYSGGERQRISVVRALAGDPPIVLADEPTASLDRASADQLTDDLFALADGRRTLIIASHDPAIQARAGRLVSVVDSKVRVSPYA
ncbi:MAG: ATP-binding cassette domain-containing protein [Pseudomonadota bacterium]